MRLVEAARRRGERIAGPAAASTANLAAVGAALVKPAGGGARIPAEQFLRQPEGRLAALIESGQVAFETADGSKEMDAASVETDVKYAGYLAREHAAVARARSDWARSR